MPQVETLYDPPDAAIQAIREGLHQYNLAATGRADGKRLALVLRDDNGEIIGGLLAELYWDWLHVSVLWLREDHRRQGHGRRLLQLAEQEALKHGITRAHLETGSFQALPFYQKHGYEVFAELPDKPKGHTWYYLKKEHLG